MPMVSVIIPAYNAEGTILQTISSVFKQIFTDFELIVINDGSNDNTLGLLENIRDEQLRVYSLRNKGVASARNCGIKQSKGKFISFIMRMIFGHLENWKCSWINWRKTRVLGLSIAGR